MKTLGLLGGMTYNATGIYYRLINAHIQRKLGGANSAPLLLHSFNHATTSALFTTNSWDQVTTTFTHAANNLKSSGADALVICCNIGHRVADDLQHQVNLPVLHIVDYTATLIRAQNIDKIALLGTQPVMDPQGFFIQRLKTKYGLEVVVPEDGTRDAIQDMIFAELGANVFHDGQKELMRKAVAETTGKGAKGVVFACTELGFVLGKDDLNVPLWDTMEAHALGVAEWALQE